ncbi:peroxiredoxin [Mycoplasmatota bacterium WC44]
MNYLDIKKFAQDDKEYSLRDFKGKNVVLYFYPKDNTPGCSTESIDFTQNKDKFEELNTLVIGVSKDSVKSHKNFCLKKELDILLLSDEDLDLIKAFDVWKLKKNYGKEYMGIERSTFILDDKGEIIKEYRKVRVKEHVETILNDLRELI